jgi:hypothetical protein
MPSIGSGNLPNYAFLIDTGAQSGAVNAAYLAVPSVASPTGRLKVWSGSAWGLKPAKVWSGSAWVTKPAKVWNGSAWI